MPRNNFSIQNILMNRLKSTNPQMYNMILTASNNGASFKDLVKQKMKGTSDEDYQKVVQSAKTFGVPDEVLKELEGFKK